MVGNGGKALEECAAADRSPVNASMIPQEVTNGQCIPLLLLQAKDSKQKGFILNMSTFKKSLEMHPAQAAAKDLKG